MKILKYVLWKCVHCIEVLHLLQTIHFHNKTFIFVTFSFIRCKGLMVSQIRTLFTVLVVLIVGRLWIYVRDRKILILKELLFRPQFLPLI